MRRNDNNNRFQGRNNFRRNNFNREPAEKHDAICTECKKKCQVPFEPDPKKDVFCAECWAKRRPPRRFAA